VTNYRSIRLRGVQDVNRSAFAGLDVGGNALSQRLAGLLIDLVADFLIGYAGDVMCRNGREDADDEMQVTGPPRIDLSF
jgi:hypothetical protein